MIAWIKENLLASKIDMLLTISGAFVIYFIGYVGILRLMHLHIGYDIKESQQIVLFQYI